LFATRDRDLDPSLDGGMRRRSRRRWLAVVAVVLAFLGSGGSVAAPCELRFGWEPYVPYQFAGEDGVVTGADVVLMRDLAAAIGCGVVLKELPWARQLLELENGTLDVSMSASRTPERAEYAYFSAPYRRAEMAVFVRRGTASQNSLSALSQIPVTGFRLGVILGYYYGQEFEELNRDPTFAAYVDPAADYRTNIRKLLHGRIDGLLVDDVAVMRAEARALNVADRVVRYPLQMPGDEFHLMLSRRSVAPDLVVAIDRELRAMEASGRIQAILEQFVQ
jgi:polar amino acid transport system substrate-binding protein